MLEPDPPFGGSAKYLYFCFRDKDLVPEKIVNLPNGEKGSDYVYRPVSGSSRIFRVDASFLQR